MQRTFFAQSHHADDRLVGAVAVASQTAGLHLLEERSDLAVLWDLRVAEDVRGQGVGSALFGAAERFAIARECRQLKVETQNVNVPARKFYVRQGCERYMPSADTVRAACSFGLQRGLTSRRLPCSSLWLARSTRKPTAALPAPPC
ncbi:GNAT family N-acetyltransferase [Planctomycetota bacterium]